MTLKLRRGLEADRAGITPAEGELIFTTDEKKVYVGDGSTAGGVAITVDAAAVSDLVNGSFTASLTSTGRLDLPQTVGSGNPSIIESDGAIMLNPSKTGAYYFSAAQLSLPGDLRFDDASIQSTAWTGSVSELTNGAHTVSLDADGVLITEGSVYGDGTNLTLSTGATAPGAAVNITAAKISFNYVGAAPFEFSANGSMKFPDNSVQTGAAISVSALKTLVAASADFADFQSRIAAL